MPGRLAVDFGTSNTVLAQWDETSHQGVPLHLPGFGKQFQQGDELISVVPSVIHYTEDGRRWIGQQVMDHNVYHSRRTLRWMKRYISQRSPIKLQLDGHEITPSTAGQDFLTTLLAFAIQQIELRDEEIALSVPVESFEHYENWLSSVAENAGIPRFRLIDEPSAAALGYGAHIQPGRVYLIFDFGGGTMHASVILVDPELANSDGRRCRVLGKAGKYLGGSTIDQWIFSEVLRQNRHMDYEEPIRGVSNQLLVSCEKLKETLSYSENADFSITLPQTGEELNAHFSRSRFEELLDENDLFTEINQVIQSAINTAAERGYNSDSIQSVFMVGGSSQIPAVQKTIRQRFGRERVYFDRPLDAVARGAASFVAGVDFYDHIQHDYAIRYIEPEKGQYDYHVIVPRGTPYPTTDPIARLTIKASYDQQKTLGLAIFEMSERRQKFPTQQQVELVFDPGGAARLMQVSAQEQENRSLFWMNEKSPTFLLADPPAAVGEPRFEVEFHVDANKRLTITVRDIVTGILTHRGFPVVRLV